MSDNNSDHEDLETMSTSSGLETCTSSSKSVEDSVSMEESDNEVPVVKGLAPAVAPAVVKGPAKSKAKAKADTEVDQDQVQVFCTSIKNIKSSRSTEVDPDEPAIPIVCFGTKDNGTLITAFTKRTKTFKNLYD